MSKLPIGDVATQYFADRDMFCAGRVPEEDLKRTMMVTELLLAASWPLWPGRGFLFTSGGQGCAVRLACESRPVLLTLFVMKQSGSKVHVLRYKS